MSLVRAALHCVGIEISRYPGATALAIHLKELLDDLSVDCVLDVGAHRGKYGRLLRAIGYRGRIISFEPNPAEHERLARAAAGDERWETRAVALSNVPGERTLNVPGSTDLASFLEPSPGGASHFGAAISPVSAVPVEMSTVAEVLDGLDVDRVLLKTDTQGFDLEVVRGAGARLDDLAAVQAEVGVVPHYAHAPDLLAFLAFMRERGFVLTGIFPGTVDRRSRALLEVDCFWRGRRDS